MAPQYVDMMNKIAALYKLAESNISSEISRKVRFDYAKQLYQNGDFNITFEISLYQSPDEEDQGIVFATNAQLKSHYDNTKDSDGGVYIISDLYYSNNVEIDATDELLFYLHDESSIDKVSVIIENFINQYVDKADNILREKYNL